MFSSPQFIVVDGEIRFSSSHSASDTSTSTLDEFAEDFDREENTALTNYASFRKKKNRGGKWSEEETERFYSGLRQFGTNFQIISVLFPKRNRRNIYLKYKHEMKTNHKEIGEAFTTREPIGKTTFSDYFANIDNNAFRC